MTLIDSFKCTRTLKLGNRNYVYYSLPAAEKNGLKGISRLPFSMKVLLEESAAPRGWANRHQGGYPGGRPVAEDQDVRT